MSRSALQFPLTSVRHSYGGSRPCPSVSLILSQGADSEMQWRIDLDARTATGRAKMGTIITAAPASSLPAARVVAVATCPGALAWVARARPVDPTKAGRGGFLILDGNDLPASCCGVEPLAGSLLVAGGPGEGAFVNAAGTAAGAVNVPTGARVRAIRLYAGGGGVATLAIGSLPTITVPASGSFSLDPEGLVGPVALTFGGAGLASYVVAYRQVG